MNNVFLLLIILSFLAIWLFIITSIIKFIKKDPTTGKKRLIYSGVSFLIFIISAIGFGMTIDSTENAQIDKKKNETALESSEVDQIETDEITDAEMDSKDPAESFIIGPTSLNKTEKENVKSGHEEKTATRNNQKQGPSASSLGLSAATVSRVVDGDTVELSDGRKVRLIGVNTPESTTRTETYGKEASNYTKSKLEGKQVYLQKDVSETDRYGRLLRIIWLEVPTDLMNENEIRSKMFNAHLVLNGYAEPSTYPPDVTYAEYFRKFAREAREKGVGLWAYGPEGTTKGDLDSNKNTTSNNSSTKNTTPPSGNTSSSKNAPSNNNTNTSNTPSSSSGVQNVPTSFKNCTEMRQYYPEGVPSTHPAYAPKHDRDQDNWACEKS